MRIGQWCKCINPGCCGFGPLTCLHCGKTILSNAKKLSKELRKVGQKIGQ